MNSLKYWLKCIAVDAIMIGVLYLWLFRGVDGAGNVALIFIWFLAIANIIGSLALDTTHADRLWRPAGLTHYHVITELFLISALAWFGYLGTAVAVLVSLSMMESSRASVLRKAGAAAPSDE